MSKRNRVRKSARKSPRKDPKKIILVVCEGRNSEPQYLNGFAKKHRHPLVSIATEPAAGVPLSVVRKAKQMQAEAKKRAQTEGDENLAYDCVWCLVDVDDHPNLPAAKQMARNNNIELAISNPSFELWLLLHFQDSPGMQNRQKVLQMLKGKLPKYDKSVNYADFDSGYHLAVERAEKILEQTTRDEEPDRNPSTRVFELTELIRESP